jgi:predicted RNA-binding Zn ribbon-like protein
MNFVFEAQWADSELIGGHTAVDFVNTAGGATKARDVERLVDYFAAIRWGCASGLLTEQEGRHLSGIAAADEDGAQAALELLRVFREALHACLMAEEGSLEWPQPQQVAVEMSIKTAVRAANLVGCDGHYQWLTTVEQQGDLSLILNRLALSAEALLRSEDLVRLKNCERCSWLFVDRGRGRPRRWCSMTTCGSRAKSARYYLRHRAIPDPA